jgi:hypothetical protein
VTRILRASLAMILIGLLAACTAASPSATEAEPTPSPTPEPTPEPTVAAPSDGGLPSFDPGAGDLDAILPDEVGGIAMQYQSAQGAGVLGSEGMTPEAQEVFTRLGATPEDLSMAFGVGFNSEGSVLSIAAFRVAGADEGQLRDEFQTTMEQDGTGVVSEGNVGGKNVIVFGTDPEAPDGYLYVKGDIAFVVAGEPIALVEEALAALP